MCKEVLQIKKKNTLGLRSGREWRERERERKGEEMMRWNGERGREGVRERGELGKRETLMQFILITRYFAA